MAFHSGLPLARGGYLGVSSFFTLSGFLIATLAIDEWRHTGHLSWRRFWERRARRLLPAALVTIAAVLAIDAWRDVGSGPRFRGDALAALGYVANWRQAAGDGGYAAIFSSPSPFVHFWSLAIEEQFYVLFPLVFAGVMALAGRPARPRGAGVRDGRRGVVLARLGRRRPVRQRRHRLLRHPHAGGRAAGRRRPRLRGRVVPGPAPAVGPSRRSTVSATLAGAAGLAVLAVAWTQVPIGDVRLFHGVTLLNAGATAAVIVAAIAARPFDRVLGAVPLRAVGKVSYGAYLLHWPIFLLLTAEGTGVDGGALFALRTAVTLAAATASYLVIEAPVRFRLDVSRPRLAAVAVACVVAVAGLAVALPQRREPVTELAVAAPAASSVVSPAAPPAGAPAAAAPAAVGGTLERGCRRCVRSPPSLRPATPRRPARSCWPAIPSPGPCCPGCRSGTTATPSGRCRSTPTSPSGARRADPVGPGSSRSRQTFPECDSWHADLGAAIARSSPDLVVLVMGLGDLGGRPIDGEWLPPGDPVHDRWLADRLDALATTIEGQGVPAVWLTFPHVRVPDTRDPTRPWHDLPVNDPTRVDRYNELVRATVDRHAGIEVVDLASWVDTWRDGSFHPQDRDGVHFTFGGSERAGGWLAPLVLQRLPS